MCVLVSCSQMAILVRLNFHRARTQNGGLASQDVVCTHNICRESIVHGWHRATYVQLEQNCLTCKSHDGHMHSLQVDGPCPSQTHSSLHKQ